MNIYIHPGDDVPIYRQIVWQVTDAIASGLVKAGDRLPSHRELAGELVIAPLTVKKAYDELERDGLIDTQRGRGTFVSEKLPERNPAQIRERLRGAAQRLLSQAALSGMTLAELKELLEEIEEGMRP